MDSLVDGTTTNRNTPTQILSSGVEQAVGGYYHSLILKTDGSLWSMGQNGYGQLGDGTITNRNAPTQILSSGVASLSDVLKPGSIITANLTTINFDDAFAEHGNGFKNGSNLLFGSFNFRYIFGGLMRLEGLVMETRGLALDSLKGSGLNGSSFWGSKQQGQDQVNTLSLFSSPIDYFLN